MNTLIMTVGLPRSGKSTWAREQTLPVVCPDAIRLALHGQPFVAEAEPFVWAIAKTMVRALFLAGHETVILDATNTTQRRRDEWRSSEWDLAPVLFDTPVAVCIKRAQASGRADLVPVIERMAAAFERPEAPEVALPC